MEPLGGAGDFVAVLQDHQPEAGTVATELHLETAKLRANRWGRVKHSTYHMDAIQFQWSSPHLIWAPFGVFVDNNRSTLLDLDQRESLSSKLLEVLPLRDPRCRWIIWTDTACGKLHLNWESYALDAPDFSLYEERLAKRLMEKIGRPFAARHYQKHARASYHLMTMEN